MRQQTLAIASAALFLAFTSTPVRATDCVEVNVTLTAESGEQYIRSCTDTNSRVQDVADRRQQPIGDDAVRDERPSPSPAADDPVVTTQSAQAR